MWTIKWLHKGLWERVESMATADRERLVRVLLLRGAEQFAWHPEVAKSASMLSAGGPVTALDAAALTAESARFDRAAEAEEDDEENGAASDGSAFRAARCLYAFSILPKGMGDENIDAILYELAHAHDDPHAFLQAAYRMVTPGN